MFVPRMAGPELQNVNYVFINCVDAVKVAFCLLLSANVTNNLLFRVCLLALL